MSCFLHGHVTVDHIPPPHTPVKESLLYFPQFSLDFPFFFFLNYFIQNFACSGISEFMYVCIKFVWKPKHYAEKKFREGERNVLNFNFSNCGCTVVQVGIWAWPWKLLSREIATPTEKNPSIQTNYTNPANISFMKNCLSWTHSTEFLPSCYLYAMAHARLVFSGHFWVWRRYSILTVI